MKIRKSVLFALACVAAWLGKSSAAADRTVEIQIHADAIAVRPLVDCALVSLAVSDPKGEVASKHFERGAAPVLELGQGGDGVYTYEVRLVPSDGSEPRVESGYFRRKGGTVFGPEDAGRPVRKQDGLAAGRAPQPNDTVYNDDLIVDGRLCVGTECLINELFNDEALKLKEPLPGIKFMDTLAGPGAHDWQIFINSFLAEVPRFAITDFDSATTPFTLRGNAPSFSLFVSEPGRVGLGTAGPNGSMHVTRSQSPSVVLEQTGNTFASPRAWRVNVDSAGVLALRDVTGGTSPLLIEAGSGSETLTVAADGNVGVNVSASLPQSALHVRRLDGSAKLLVQEASSTIMARTMLELKNTGPANIRLNNTSAGNFWGLGHNGLSNFYITNELTPFPSLALQLTPYGDLTILGTLTQTSDRNTKDDLAPVDPEAILAGVAELSIGTWHRKTDEPGVRHLGPMAQDFAAAFGLGDDDRRISPLDVGGVALVAVQALDARAKALERRNTDLARRLEKLEASGGDR